LRKNSRSDLKPVTGNSAQLVATPHPSFRNPQFLLPFDLLPIIIVKNRICMSENLMPGLGYQIPEIFADEDVIMAYLKDCGLKDVSKHVGKLCYLLNYFRVTPRLDKEGASNYGWVLIDTSIVRNLFGDLKYYYPIIKKLKHDDFLEVYKSENDKEFYEVGKSCKKYRLTQLINNMEWKVMMFYVWNCSTTSKLTRFYQKEWEPIDFSLFNLLKEFQIEVIPFFENTTVDNFMKSDYNEVQMIKAKAEEKMEKNRKRKLNKIENMTLEDTMQRIYRPYKDSYVVLREGGSALRHQPDKYGRRHTNITNLAKWLRGKLYVIKCGQKRYLKEVDVKNSQVLLLLSVLNSSLPGYDDFKQKVETGTFYEFLGERLNFILPLSDYDRSKIKTLFFKFIYGYNIHYVWYGKVGKVMKATFPALFDFIKEFKNKHGYEKLAQTMQKAESDIIIHHVSKEALKRGLLFTQIYDSILCLEEDIETFNVLIKEGFKSKGMAAKTNIDVQLLSQTKIKIDT
jgi:hypothetical protein